MGVLDRIRSAVAPPAPIAAAVVRRVDTTGQMPKPRAESREGTEAWEAWRRVGEIHYSTTQQARLVGRLDWTLRVNGGEPMDTASSDAVLTAAFGEGFRDLAVRSALHLQVPGGYHLCRTRPSDPNSWKIIGYSPNRADREAMEASDIVIVVREEDPADSARNDSPVLASLDTARALILARAQERAQSRNRTAQHGILVYANETKLNESELMDVITAPLANEGSAASVVPNLIGVPAEFVKDGFNQVDLGGDYDEKLSDKIDRLVRSLAVQLDVPPELLLGFGDTNHWSAWAIQEDNWLGHVEPLAAPIGRGFAEAIMAATDTTGLALEPDPGPLLQRRPTPTDALAAYEAMLVSGDWTREQIGANETDAPTPEEIAARTPLAPAVPAPPAAAEPIAASLTWEQVQERLPQRPVVAAVKSGPDPRALAAIDTQAYDATEDLVSDTADRALERLGAKVRSMAQRSQIDVPTEKTNAEVAVAFTGQIPNADTMIADTIAAAAPKVERIITRAFARTRSAGVDVHPDPDDLAGAQALFASLVSDVVASRLAAAPTHAACWQAARRVVSVAGGSPDPVQMVA